MQETPKPTKKALQQRIKEAQKALKAAEESELYPSLRKKCKYCHLVFTTAATRNGQKQEFCKPAHRWAFAREGKKPIDVILKRQEKRLRQIAREEIQSAILERFGGFQRTEFFEIMGRSRKRRSVRPSRGCNSIPISCDSERNRVRPCGPRLRNPSSDYSLWLSGEFRRVTYRPTVPPVRLRACGGLSQPIQAQRRSACSTTHA